MKKTQTGGCLCGNIRFTIKGEPSFPHYCSCKTCQKWSGAPIVAWVDFPRTSIVFEEGKGKLSLYQSSEKTQRGFCNQCGGTICAIDDGSDKICMTLSSFDDPNFIAPKSQSFKESAPTWLKVSASAPKPRSKSKSHSMHAK